MLWWRPGLFPARLTKPDPRAQNYPKGPDYLSTTIVDIVQRCTLEAQNKLRYHPDWTGVVHAKGVVIAGTITVVAIETRASDRVPKQIGNRVDVSKTNKTGFRLFSQKLLETFEGIRGRQDYYGEIGGSIEFRLGTLVRVATSETIQSQVPHCYL